VIPRHVVSLLVLFALGAAPLPPTIYVAPGGTRVAGASNPGNPYNLVLPNGRIVAPAGTSIVVGMNALGVALTPDGRYAIVTNDDEREANAYSRYAPQVRGGYSLAVVDTATMRVASVYNETGDQYQFFLGVAALTDPKDPSRTIVLASGGPSNLLHVLRVDVDGILHEDESPIALPSPNDPRYANQAKAYPGWIALSANHQIAYVVNNLANTVSAVDLASRGVLQSAPVGYFP